MLQTSHLSLIKKLQAGVQALGRFMVHSPDYRPAGKNIQRSQYQVQARLYPFCEPIVEQRAWLEHHYQNSADS